MNFLAHYYFDRKKGNPAFSLGLLMPDLVRNFIHTGKKTSESTQTLRGEALNIHLGSEQHHHSDKFFHSCAPFVQLNEHVIQKLRLSSLEFKRDWFLAHIFVELMLDRVILQMNPLLSTELYEDLNAIKRHEIEEYLRTVGIHEIEIFFEGFNRFLAARYLDTYTDSDSIAYAMSRIASRMHIDISDSGHKRFLSHLAIEMEPQITNFKRFLDDSLE